MKTQFLDFYKKALMEGSIQSQTTEEAKRYGVGGLCHTGIAHTEEFRLIEYGTRLYYWGYDADYEGGIVESDDIRFSFTPLRQTVVLLCAAINNEL